MWGGSVVSTMDHNATLLDAFAHYAHNAPRDIDAQAFTAFVWFQEHSTYVISSQLTYLRPVEAPEILANFTAVPNVQSSLRVASMAELAEEIQKTNPNGLRESYWTATFKATREMAQILLDVYLEEVEKIKHVEGTVPALIYQAVTTDMIARFSRNGGNCLGIEEEDGPLMLMNFAVWWTNEEDDELVLSTAKSIIDRSVERAKEVGAHHRYLYQNYADISQDVLAGYGEENLEKLREISRKYDPEQVFQKLQPGYFKL